MVDAQAAPPADVPEFMMCNIGLCLVEDPVTGIDGKLYSRAALERYVRERGMDPSRNPMTLDEIKPNRQVEEMLVEFHAGTADLRKTLHGTGTQSLFS